jgi:hypothetical protein
MFAGQTSVGRSTLKLVSDNDFNDAASLTLFQNTRTVVAPVWLRDYSDTTRTLSKPYHFLAHPLGGVECHPT